ncbi:fnip repeat-containing protein [Moumouvirus maliensis]|nr:fnip repeat-containing protein [Moumouvirus maliensis]
MSIINILNLDVVLYMVKFLSDKEKLIFCSTNKYFRELLDYIKFDDLYEYDQIKDLPFITKFKKISYKSHDVYVPKYVTYLTFGDNYNERIKPCFFYFPKRKFKKILPPGLTYLKFGWFFNQPIKKYIPNNVTHLIFGNNFNQPIGKIIIDDIAFSQKKRTIERYLPPKLIYLEFGDNFNQSIEGCIPDNVTHLKFGYYFNQPIKEYIPNSVTHLTLKKSYYEQNKQFINTNICVQTFT